MNAPFTNQPGAGLDANGNLLPGYKYMTYSNGVGQGTPMQIGALGAGGQTVTGNAPPAAGTYNPNITAGPQQYANPTTANMAPQYRGQQTGPNMRGYAGPSTGQPYQSNQQFQPYGSFGQQSQYSQQQSPFAYQNPFQSSTYSQPSGQAFNTQNNPFNRSNQGGLLSGGSYQFGGLLNY